MPPTPMRANFLPASGFVAGTLQKTSCAARRRLDQPASSDAAGGLGEVTGAGDAAATVAATLPPAGAAAGRLRRPRPPPEPHAAPPSTAMAAAAIRTELPRDDAVRRHDFVTVPSRVRFRDERK